MGMAQLTKAKTHTRYRLPDGTPVPSVTTVINVLGLNKQALIAWAARLAAQGIDPLKYRDEVADVGSCAHEMVRAYFAGQEPNLAPFSAEQIALAKNALASFRQWIGKRKLEPILVEHPLVSTKYRVGGTIDWYGLIDGVHTLVDFKTASAIHLEHRIQVTAYREILREHGYPVKAVRIIRIGREEGDEFQDYKVRRFREYLELFKLARRIYDIARELERSAA